MVAIRGANREKLLGGVKVEILAREMLSERTGHREGSWRRSRGFHGRLVLGFTLEFWILIGLEGGDFSGAVTPICRFDRNIERIWKINKN
jgi:hypothetical protein